MNTVLDDLSNKVDEIKKIIYESDQLRANAWDKLGKLEEYIESIRLFGKE